MTSVHRQSFRRGNEGWIVGNAERLLCHVDQPGFGGEQGIFETQDAIASGSNIEPDDIASDWFVEGDAARKKFRFRASLAQFVTVHFHSPGISTAGNCLFYFAHPIQNFYAPCVNRGLLAFVSGAVPDFVLRACHHLKFCKILPPLSVVRTTLSRASCSLLGVPFPPDCGRRNCRRHVAHSYAASCRRRLFARVRGSRCEPYQLTTPILTAAAMTAAPAPVTATNKIIGRSGSVGICESSVVSSVGGDVLWVHHRRSWRSAPPNPRDRNFPTGTKLSPVNSVVSPNTYGRSKRPPVWQPLQRQTSARLNAGCAESMNRRSRSSWRSSTKCFGSKPNSICNAAA